MAHPTSEEIKAQHIESMGRELGEFFFLLEQDLSQLYVQWNEYVDAFGTNEGRVDLLNSAAGGFARSVQDALWADVLLGLTRLTDPAESDRGRKNLTIKRLSELLDGDIKEVVGRLIEAASEATGFARDWRNRYLAHRDLSHAINSNATPLKEASRLKVREALEAIVAVMNEVQRQFEDSTTMYSEARHINGVVHLLYVVDDGLRLEQERRARLEAGNPLPQDFAPREI